MSRFKISHLGLLSAVLLLVLAVALCGCGNSESAESDTPAAQDDGYFTLGEPLTDSTLAAVIESDYGTDTLTAEEFELQITRFLQQAQGMELDESQNKLLRRSVIEDFVMRHMLTGEVRERGIEADTALVEQQIGMIRSRFPDEAAFESTLAQQGLTMDSLRNALTLEAQMQTLTQRYAEEAADASPEELEAYRQEQAEQISAQHILFMTPPGMDAAAEDSIRTVAEAVLDSAQSGVPFEELARRHSDDGSAAQGGDLGFFGRNAMVEPFEDAAFALADSGAVTEDLVKTRFGYHIIRLTGRRTVEPPDSARAAAMLQRERQMETLEATMDRLRHEATLRVNPAVIGVDVNEEMEM